MKVQFLEATDVERSLEALLAEYDEVYWAVAWGTANSLSGSLLSHSGKFRAVTFGLSFAQTDPDLIDLFVGVPGCYVVSEFPGGTFHPKVYAFRSGERAAAIIGSANFTRGGMGNNHEASILIAGTINDQVLADALAYAARSAELGNSVTEGLALRYRLSYELAARKPRVPRNPLDDVSSISLDGLRSPLLGMSWVQYVYAVQSSRYHDVDKSLSLLRIAQTWLSAAPSFEDLSITQRKAIAGVIGERDKSRDPELNLDWGWFGSMRGAGDFKNRISENDRFLAHAVDSIPQKGDIRREDFDRFLRLFAQAFKNSHRVGGVATASRLLAIKRPDVFLCVSKPNIGLAAKKMGFAKTTLSLENYWDRVVEVIRASDWYNVAKPEGGGGKLWECRAAMLDAIFYQP